MPTEISIANMTLYDIQRSSIRKWKESSSEKLRQDYPILEKNNSVFIDLGVFDGNWSKQILDKYPNSHGIGFEPIASQFNIAKTILTTPRYSLLNFAAGEKAENVIISLEAQGSSSHKKTEHSELCNKIKFTDFIRETDLIDNSVNIDLLKINIEGDEFSLLLDLIDSGMITKFTNIQVQFHPFIEGAEEMYRGIKNELDKTHRTTYSYPWIWENWELAS